MALKVMLDAGHGSGAVHKRGFVNLDGWNYNNEGECNYIFVTNYLKPALEKYGIIVGLTRNKMTDNPSISARGKAGKGYDIFISSHTNGGGGVARGAEIWEDINPIYQNPELSAKLVKGISGVMGIPNRGVKHRKTEKGNNYYGVLRSGLAKYNIIIEHAFHDNYKDALIYVNSLQKIADKIAEIIAIHYNLVKKESNSSIQKPTSPQNNPKESVSIEGNLEEIIKKATCTKKQMREYAKIKGSLPPTLDLVGLYYDLSVERGIDPAISFCQFLKETGFMYKNGSSAGLNESFHNPCGLKIPIGGGDYEANAHKRFATWEEGIISHLDHLALYCGVDKYPKYSQEVFDLFKSQNKFYNDVKFANFGTTTDPRHFPYLLGTVKTVRDLGGKWAPSKTYGDDIVKMANELRAIKVKEEEQPSEWAVEYWDWATKNEIMSGNPKGNVTREQLAKILLTYRNLTKYNLFKE